MLLVEDNALVRDTLQDVLKRAGHEVDCADDGEAGWEALQAATPVAPYDVLVTDLNLPRLSGRDLLVRAHGRGLARAMLVLSGVVENRLSAELNELGVARILQKPIAMTELLAALDDVGRR